MRGDARLLIMEVTPVWLPLPPHDRPEQSQRFLVLSSPTPLKTPPSRHGSQSSRHRRRCSIAHSIVRLSARRRRRTCTDADCA